MTCRLESGLFRTNSDVDGFLTPIANSYYDAFLLIFEQALKLTMMMPETSRQQFLDRLDVVRKSNQNISGCVAGECDEFWLR